MSKKRTLLMAVVLLVIIIIGIALGRSYNQFSGVNPTQTPTIPPSPSPTSVPSATNSSESTDQSDNITVANSLLENGLCYGPFRDGQSPDGGIFPTEQQITEDLQVLKGITGSIRTYSSTNGSENIPVIAKQYGLKVYQGVYLGANNSKNEEEIQNAVSLANRNLVDSIIVGNEKLLSNTMSENSLIQYIQEVKQSVPTTVRVTTAESWNIWLNHPNLAKEVDYLLIHVHPFWESQPIETAAQYVIDKYNNVTEQYPNKQVVIGETGWPTAGNTTWTGVSPLTVPNQANQMKFIQAFTQLAKHSIRYFFFDAFDEEFKWQEKMTTTYNANLTTPADRTFTGTMAGSSWGIFQSDGQIKPMLKDFFPGIQQVQSRKTIVVFDNGKLSAGYEMSVDSSEHLYNWLSQSNQDGSMRMDYPTSQSWGAVFISVGQLTDSSKPYKDFSKAQTLSLTIKGESGNEQFYVGLKDANAPQNSSTEKRYLISNTTTLWQTYHFALDSFAPTNTSILNIPVEFVFSGSTPQTVYFKTIEFSP
jgi:exo-beta-1,3-glucanase (GH17 family)